MLDRTSTYSVRTLAFLTLLFLPSCRDDFAQEPLCEMRSSTTAERGSERNPFFLEAGSVAITPMDPREEEECSRFSTPFHFTIEEAHAGTFFLQPALLTPYCIEVHRESGYITLRHEEGVVHRAENLFTWCLTRNEAEGTQDENTLVPEPALLEVLSLTPSAQFSITLMRGREHIETE